jgi:tellurite resistance protein TerC
MDVTTVGSPALWAGFIGFVLVMLALDLGVFNRRAHEIRMREALIWSVVWITLSLLFGAWIWHHFGAVRGLEFLTGYLLEKALSVDNLFVFIVLFSYFAVPVKLQHRVLFWGILGALVMRAIFIVAGAALIHRFHWIIFVFGVFLVFTGIKLLRHRGGEMHPERNPVLRVFRRLVPLTTDYRGARFFVREGGRWLATPLLMVLVVVEATDIVFAVDSIPAIFAITTDPFIVFTSNIFAILGLRAMYFLLAGMMGRFRYLKVGLGLVLVFVGIKMLLADVVELPVVVSLGVIATLLGGSIAVSLLRTAPERQDGAPPA